MRPTRFAALFGLALAAVVATSGTALAVPPPPPPPSSSGKVGTFALVESEEVPAVTCFYADPEASDGNNYLWKMASIAPRVKAAAGRSSQKVAWRLVVQFSDDDGATWRSYGRSTWTAATAKPAVAAPLAKRSVRLRTWDDAITGPAAWRAKAEIRWYASNGTTITGRGAVWATWYRARWDPNPPFVWSGPSCGWTTG